MKVRSVTDVVTNSSSEVYTINPRGKNPDDILEDLLRVNADFMRLGVDMYSGSVQDIRHLSNMDVDGKSYPEFLLDQGFFGTKKYIMENYDVYGTEHW